MTEETEGPVVDFNDEWLAEQIATRRAATGLYAAICVSASRHYKEGSSNLSAKLVWRYLQNPEDENSITGLPIAEWVMFPLGNPDDPNHRPPQGCGERFGDAMSGILSDEELQFPKFNRNAGVMMYKSEPIDETQVIPARLEAFKKCIEVAKKYWGKTGENLDQLVGIVKYVETFTDKSGFIKFRSRHDECPEDWTLDDKFVVLEELPPELMPPKQDSDDAPKPAKRTRRKKAE